MEDLETASKLPPQIGPIERPELVKPHETVDLTERAPMDPAGHRLVYALGVLGYDLGTEARHDAFRSRMSAGGSSAPPEPHDSRQMAAHLAAHPEDARQLGWTLSI